MHFPCAAKSYQQNPGKPCVVCDPLTHSELWDKLLNFDTDEPAAASSGGAGGVRGVLSTLLDSCIDPTERYLTSNLPVRALRHRQITPAHIIERYGTDTLDFLLKNTNYTPEQLVHWGFDFETFLEAGLSVRHCAVGQDLEFFVYVVGSLKNLLEVFSGNHDQVARSKYPVAIYVALSQGMPAIAMAACGFKARHLVAMGFTLNEWCAELGLTKVLMSDEFQFDYDTCFALISQDPERWPEFRQKLGFLPFKKQTEPVSVPVPKAPSYFHAATFGAGFTARNYIQRPIRGVAPKR